MKLKTQPIVSDQIFLADVSPTFALQELDGNPEVATHPELRAWVKVKQATTGDNRRRADLNKERERRWIGDGDGNVGAVGVVYKDNPVIRRMLEVEMTIVETGNLEDEEGKPLFELPIKKAETFEKRWMSLETWVTNAIYLAVLQANPGWGADQGE